jgi:hypothetical protein
VALLRTRWSLASHGQAFFAGGVPLIDERCTAVDFLNIGIGWLRTESSTRRRGDHAQGCS